MPNYTTNLNLLKKNPGTDGSDYFDIQTMLNDNWDKIDAGVKAVDDKVTTHEAEITSLQNEVENNQAQLSVSLSNTTPVVSIDAPVSGPLDLAFTAPDLVANIVKNGNFANGTIGWVGSNASIAASNNVLSVTGTGAGLYVSFRNNDDKLYTGKKYYIREKIRVTNSVCLALRMFLGSGQLVKTQANPVQNTWYSLSAVATTVVDYNYATVTESQYADTATANGKVTEVQEVMVVDLTAMFGAGNEPTQAWCDANFSYVNGIQPLMNPMMTVREKNLFNKNSLPIVYYTSISDVEVFSTDTGIRIRTKTNGTYRYIKYAIKLKPNTSYTLSRSLNILSGASHGSAGQIYITNSVEGAIGTYTRTGSPYTFTTDNNGLTNFAFYVTHVTSESGDIEFNNLQLEESLTATTYKPYKESSTILVGEFAKLPNTTYADTVTYEKDVAKVLRRVKKVILDGSLPWVYGNTYTGYKKLQFSVNDAVSLLGAACKYDGKILSFSTTPNIDVFTVNSGFVMVFPSVAETGFGDSYIASTVEIQAFMNGWKMNNGTFGTPYNGTGTKTWTKWNADDNTGAITTVPTIKADGWAGWATLWYALSTPVEEKIQTIGSVLSLSEGACTLDIQTGVVYEKANIKQGYGVNINYVLLNTIDSSMTYETNQSYKCKNVIAVYRNNIIDTNWFIQQHANYYGGGGAYAFVSSYDYDAEYYVLYQVLPEEYNNQQINLSAYYDQNLRDAHNELVETVGNMAKDLSLFRIESSEDIKSHSAEIVSLQDEVENTQPPLSVALSNTTPVVSIDAPIGSSFDVTFTAPDLVSNIANFGGCEETTSWNGSSATDATDSANKYEGTNCIKIITTAAQGSIYRNILSLLNTSKYYLVSAYVKNGNATNGVRLKLTASGDGGTIDPNSYSASTSYVRQGIIIQPSNFDTATQVILEIIVSGTTGQYAYVDAISINEITSAEYALGAAAIMDKYPYVNGIQPLMNPMLTVRGKNLFDILAPKHSDSTYLTTGYVDGNTLVVTTTSTSSVACYYGWLFRLKPNTNYYIKCDSTRTNTTGGGINVYSGETGWTNILNKSSELNPAGTFNSGSTGIVRILFYTKTSGSDLAVATFSNIQLEESTTATAYKPYDESSAIFVGEFAKLPNTTYADTVTYENGKTKVLRKLNKVVLDGTFSWTWRADYTGFKRISFAGLNSIDYQSMVSKYNGTILTNIGAGAFSAADQQAIYTNGNFHITINNADSGWGETYNPTAAEMQACMNGWKMYPVDTGITGNPYPGTGTKGWCRVGKYDMTTLTLPTIKAPEWTGWATLWYALATPVEEEIQVIGNVLEVFEGHCTLDVQTGIVYEKAIPDVGPTNTYINITVTPTSYLSRKNKSIIKIFKNNVIDNLWTIETQASAYGTQRAVIATVNYDKTAEYYALYQALPEEYNSQQISLTGYYSQNLRDAHNELAETVGNVAKELSLLEESVKAEWKNWTPTLTWTTATPTIEKITARYMAKDKIVYFKIHIIITNGLGATGLKVSLPITPKAIGSSQPFSALEKVNTTWSNPFAYANDNDTNGIQFLAFSTMTAATGAVLILEGFYEID